MKKSKMNANLNFESILNGMCIKNECKFNSKQIFTTNHKSESKMTANVNSELILNEI